MTLCREMMDSHRNTVLVSPSALYRKKKAKKNICLCFSLKLNRSNVPDGVVNLDNVAASSLKKELEARIKQVLTFQSILFLLYLEYFLHCRCLMKTSSM